MKGIMACIAGATLASLVGGCELQREEKRSNTGSFHLPPVEVIDLELPTKHFLLGQTWQLYEKRRIVSADFVISERTRKVCDLDYKLWMVVSNDGYRDGQNLLRVWDRIPVQLAPGETYVDPPRTHTAGYYGREYHLTPTSEPNTFHVAAHLFWLVEDERKER